jgi:beta-N-acetylhexosaminidase
MAGTIARALRVLGFHQSYLPVLDLGGDRSLSDDPNAVARLGAAFVDGLQSDGVAACGKHFPGQRDPSVDLIPFRSVVHAEIASIMTPHPVTFSEQLLRRGLGFEGVIAGDRRAIDVDVVRAIGAGCDQLLLDVAAIPRAYAAIREAVETGALSIDRILASVARIDRLKTSYVFGRPGPIAGDFVAHLPTSEHASLLAELETGPKVTPLGDGIVEYDFEGDPDETLELDV